MIKRTYYYLNYIDVTGGDIESCRGEKEMSLALAMTYNPKALKEGSHFLRDTVRLYDYWGDESVGIAVSLVESVENTSRFLRCDFSSKTFINELEEHMRIYDLKCTCIGEIILDYIWMPDGWAIETYGRHNFGLLQNLVELARRQYPSIHIKEGGVIYLPTSWQLYHGIVMSEYWKELKELYRVDYIKHADAQSNPLVRSDMQIKHTIARLGKNVDHELVLLKSKGEKIYLLNTVDLEHWSGCDDIFMKLIRSTRQL